jgi:hypothetical protein
MATATVKYSLAVADLCPEFSNMFTDFESNKKSMNLFSIHFSEPIDNVPSTIQMEITDPQRNSGLKEKYNVRHATSRTKADTDRLVKNKHCHISH